MTDRVRTDRPHLEVIDCREERPEKWAKASPGQVAQAWGNAYKLVDHFAEAGEKIRRDMRRERFRREQAARTEGIARRRRVRRAREELGFEIINGERDD